MTATQASVEVSKGTDRSIGGVHGELRQLFEVLDAFHRRTDASILSLFFAVAVSPKSRGRPARRGRSKASRQRAVRRARLSDRLVADAHLIASEIDVLKAERRATGWLGQAW